MTTQHVDYTVENHGSLFLFRPETPEAQAHLEAHVDDEAQWFGDALAVEPRYAADLAAQLGDDGFVVR